MDAGAAVPHLHADIGSGEVIVELLPDGSVRLSEAHGAPIRGQITMRELRVVLKTAGDAYLELVNLCKASQQR